MKQYDRQGIPEELWVLRNWMESTQYREALKERWKREQAERDEAIRKLRLEEFIRERDRRERRNMLRDLLGI